MAKTGFDLGEVVVSTVTVADGRRFAAPRIAPIRVTFGDRWCSADALVLGEECLMGALALEGMDLVVDPMRERVVANPAHPEGPVFRA